MISPFSCFILQKVQQLDQKLDWQISIQNVSFTFPAKARTTSNKILGRKKFSSYKKSMNKICYCNNSNNVIQQKSWCFSAWELTGTNVNSTFSYKVSLVSSITSFVSKNSCGSCCVLMNPKLSSSFTTSP